MDVYGGSFNDIETVEEVADEPQLVFELYTFRICSPLVPPVNVKPFAVFCRNWRIRVPSRSQ